MSISRGAASLAIIICMTVSGRRFLVASDGMMTVRLNGAGKVKSPNGLRIRFNSARLPQLLRAGSYSSSRCNLILSPRLSQMVSALSMT